MKCLFCQLRSKLNVGFVYVILGLCRPRSTPPLTMVFQPRESMHLEVDKGNNQTISKDLSFYFVLFELSCERDQF